MFPKQLILKKALQPCWSLHLRSYKKEKTPNRKATMKGNTRASYGNHVYLRAARIEC